MSVKQINIMAAVVLVLGLFVIAKCAQPKPPHVYTNNAFRLIVPGNTKEKPAKILIKDRARFAVFAACYRAHWMWNNDKGEVVTYTDIGRGHFALTTTPGMTVELTIWTERDWSCVPK